MKKGDILICYDGRKIELINIYSVYCKDKNKHTLPYKIPKNTSIHDTVCNKDLYLSPLHEILFEKKLFTSVKNLDFNQIDSSEIDSIVYYHLVLPNYYTDAIFANGIICEGYAEFLTPKNKLYHKIIVETIYKNKCRRLLSNNEFNTFIQENIYPYIFYSKKNIKNNKMSMKFN